MFHLLVNCLAIALTGVTFSGKVVDQSDNPIKSATVAIDSARPREGESIRLASAYSDCQKRTTTDDAGMFQFDNVDEGMLFELAVGADKRKGQMTSYLDPKSNAPIIVKLESFAPENLYDEISGTIVGEDGSPLSGCEVIANDETRGGMFTTQITGVNPVCFSNVKGEFHVAIEKNIDGARFVLRASGYCDVMLDWRRESPRRLDFKMHRGASITGRFVRNEKPLANLLIGIVQADRSYYKAVTPMEIFTDSNGVFRFDHLPADIDYHLYSRLGQEVDSALPATLVKAPLENQVADLGDVEAEAAQKLKITVSTTDGSNLPEKTSVGISCKNWEYVSRKLASAPRGEVTFSGLAPGVYGVHIRVNGYEIEKTIPATSVDLNQSRDVYIDPGQDSEFTIILKPTSGSTANK